MCITWTSIVWHIPKLMSQQNNIAAAGPSWLPVLYCDQQTCHQHTPFVCKPLSFARVELCKALQMTHSAGLMFTVPVIALLFVGTLNGALHQLLL